MDSDRIRRIVEAALLASDGPLTIASLSQLFLPGELDEEHASKQIREALKALEQEAEQRGVELKRVASGYRYQVRQDLSEWVSRLWDEKPPRYTRALLETLALIAYQQPVTRGDIEQVRGVSVSQNIMRTLLERDWIRVVGQKEVPGRPSLYGTTKAFLDYFNLKSLDELPPLPEIRALIEPALVEEGGETGGTGAETGTEIEAKAVQEGAQEQAGAPTSPPMSGNITAHVEMPGDDQAAEPEAGRQPDDPQQGSAEVVQLHKQPKS